MTIFPLMVLDYAWAGAVTDDSCRDLVYQYHNSDCKAQSILAGRQAYRQKGFNRPSKHSVADVQVRGLVKQVDLFIHDSATQPKLADDKTLYVILIVDIDLYLSLFDQEKYHFISVFTVR